MKITRIKGFFVRHPKNLDESQIVARIQTKWNLSLSSEKHCQALRRMVGNYIDFS